jgi:two-component system, NtrC family, sensor histidine kinase HydH
MLQPGHEAGERCRQSTGRRACYKWCLAGRCRENAVTHISKENLDEVQAEAFLRRFQRFSPRRRLVLLPILAWLMLLLLVGDRAVWRSCVLGATALAAIVGVVVELIRGNWMDMKFRALRSVRATLLGVGFMGALTFATGGFDSPVLPFVIPLCLFIGTLAAPRLLIPTAVAAALLVALLAVISARHWVPDLMPAVFGGGAGVSQPPALLYAKAAVLMALLGWVAIVAGGLRQVFHDIVGEVLDARDEVLQGHDAHARELTALSGELAHELKNPLANMKGLAVLVGRDVQGKGVERLEGLQHEVSRMEEILQGFLTFSRPLSPLNAENVDLRELCESALALHEGVAQSKDVSPELRALAPVSISCDPRKVRQILINLMQNALEASPAGASVEVVVAPAPDGGARVEVSDRGPGIPEAVRAHLFEPGATTKERGTGLGLALARGLARQHGGELSLVNRDGGGCTATLTLPDRPKLATTEVAA